MQQPEVIPPPEAPGLKQEGLTLIDRAKLVTITDDPSYQVACAGLVRVAGLKKNIDRAFDGTDAEPGPQKLAHRAWQAISKLHQDLLAYPVEAERLYKGAIARYQSEQMRIRREEQTRIEQELRKREEDRRMAEAEALAAGGQQEAAEELLDQPVFAPVVELAAPSAPGVSSRKHYSFRIVDPSKINRDYLVPDETKIRKIVNALGLDAMQLVGGIEVIEDQIVAVRA